MACITLRHVNKSYTSYSTEIVLTGQARESRTRQVLQDLTVPIPGGAADGHRRPQRLRQEHPAQAPVRDGDAGRRRIDLAHRLAQRPC